MGGWFGFIRSLDNPAKKLTPLVPIIKLFSPGMAYREIRAVILWKMFLEPRDPWTKLMLVERPLPHDRTEYRTTVRRYRHNPRVLPTPPHNYEHSYTSVGPRARRTMALVRSELYKLTIGSFFNVGQHLRLTLSSA